ncbi:hypothetical protein, partial [Limnobacter sp.]|uniref:hypothetical protein n=1 Tax=Limnobacter sp. TaxID=2003368 RepID=UPI002FE05CB3
CSRETRLCTSIQNLSNTFAKKFVFSCAAPKVCANYPTTRQKQATDAQGFFDELLKKKAPFGAFKIFQIFY